MVGLCGSIVVNEGSLLGLDAFVVIPLIRYYCSCSDFSFVQLDRSSDPICSL